MKYITVERPKTINLLVSLNFITYMIKLTDRVHQEEDSLQGMLRAFIST